MIGRKIVRWRNNYFVANYYYKYYILYIVFEFKKKLTLYYLDTVTSLHIKTFKALDDIIDFIP